MSPQKGRDEAGGRRLASPALLDSDGGAREWACYPRPMTTDTERDEERVRQLAAKLMTVVQTPDDVRLLPRAVKMLTDQQRASKRQKKTQSPRRVRAKG